MSFQTDIELLSRDVSSDGHSATVTWCQFILTFSRCHVISAQTDVQLLSRDVSSEDIQLLSRDVSSDGHSSTVTWCQFRRTFNCSHVMSVQAGIQLLSRDVSSDGHSANVTWCQFIRTFSCSHVMSVQAGIQLLSREPGTSHGSYICAVLNSSMCLLVSGWSKLCWLRSCKCSVQWPTGLWAERAAAALPAGAADLSRRPSVESTEPPVITARTVLCPGAERLDVKLTVGLHVVPTVRRGGAVPLLPLFVFMG